MKKLFLVVAAALMAVAARCEITATDCGARITLDSITTEVIIYAPDAVRVIKYVGDRPQLPALKVKGIPGRPEAKNYRTDTGHNKYKVDTGRMYAALNEKDANVSFWSLGDTLIMAEQHKTGLIRPSASGKGYAVSQDFQMGRAAVDNIYSPSLKESKRINLKGVRTAVGDRKAGLPDARIATDKGFEIVWLSPLPAEVNATPREEKKKQGDITVSSSSAPFIDYLFILRR